MFVDLATASADPAAARQEHETAQGGTQPRNAYAIRQHETSLSKRRSQITWIKRTLLFRDQLPAQLTARSGPPSFDVSARCGPVCNLVAECPSMAAGSF